MDQTVNRVNLVKPELARLVGDRIIQMAQMRQITSRVDDDQLKAWLEQAGEQTSKKTTVKFERKRRADDDDDY